VIKNMSSDAERKFARDNLMRLANSCERAAARGKAVSPLAHDLSDEDFRDIAAILRGLLTPLD
jgi:hypothetical protein